MVPPENLSPRVSGLSALTNSKGRNPQGRRPRIPKRTQARRQLARAALELALGLGVLLDRIGLGIDRLRIGRRRLDLGGVVLRHALLERLDALREVAHQRGDLAASAEQDE